MSRSRRPPWGSSGLLCFGLVFLAWTVLGWTVWQADGVQEAPLNWYVSVLWTLPTLASWIGLTGILRTVAGRRREAPAAAAPPRVPDLLVVLVPTVARPDTLVALERVVRTLLEHLPAHFERVRIDLVVEEDCTGQAAALAAYPWVRIVTVPAGYRTERGTRFKARANHYANELRGAEGEARDDVWILHLDDDTGIGADTAEAVARFIRAQACAGGDARHLAQGVLSFPRELAANRLLWLADAARPACDLSLYAATTGRGSPRIGLHGELLLVRASVESEIGWDFGPDAIVEDAQFALEFTGRHPGGSEWFSARSYGVSPATLADFLRQRERWFLGLLTLVSNPGIPLRRRALLLSLVAVWSTAPLQTPAIVIAAGVLVSSSTNPVSPLIIPIWSLNIAYCVWLYWQGLRVNADASRRRARSWWEPLLVVLLLPLFSLWEAAGVARGCARFLRRDERTFAVIVKSA